MTLINKKPLLQPYLALYVQFSWCALFIKATPTNYTIHQDFNYHINERETPKTCLTNHKGSISHHITLLVINSLRGGHTHTYIADKSNFKKSGVPAKGRHAPGLKISFGINLPFQHSEVLFIKQMFYICIDYYKLTSYTS